MIPGTEKAAVFLDRDGTLIREVHYLRRVEQLEILPGVVPGLLMLRAHGFKLVMVTNQSAVARGRLSEEDLQAIHGELMLRLARDGVNFDGVYYCPHHPTEGIGDYRRVCACRKPKTGMIERAAQELGIDPALSYVIGDQPIDIELAKGAGAMGIFLGAEPTPHLDAPALADLWEAAQWIVGRRPSPCAGETQR